MKANIVVIDDEIDLCELLEYNLSKAGFVVTTFLHTRYVEKFLDEEEVDLLIVDRNLLDAEGALFVKELRKKGYNEPVIFLSAKSTSANKLEGFSSGCDDYITKPFELAELLARITALLKRYKKQQDTLKFKEILLNLNTKEVEVNGEFVELTKLEFQLLYEFIANKNQILSREFLAEWIWQGSQTSDKTVNIAIKRLRQKLKTSSKYIKSIRSQGYKLC